MTARAAALALFASLVALAAAAAAWWLAEFAAGWLDLPAVRPLAILAFVFLSLSLLQTMWDRVASHLKHRARAARPPAGRSP